MGRTPSPPTLRSADDILDLLLGFADEIVGQERALLVGHSAGVYDAQGFAARRPDCVAGLGLVCPVLAGARNVPDHHPLVTADDLGDDGFRGYFVGQTPAMLERYEQYVAPAVLLADAAALERIGQRLELTVPKGPAYGGPTLVVAGRQDSCCRVRRGYRPAQTLPARVLDGAGHALPHELAELLAELLQDWLARTGPDPSPT